MKMTGFNSKYGAFETKADRKENLIAHAKKINAKLEEIENPTSHIFKSLFNEALRVERILATEYGMSEEEIYEATN